MARGTGRLSHAESLSAPAHSVSWRSPCQGALCLERARASQGCARFAPTRTTSYWPVLACTAAMCASRSMTRRRPTSSPRTRPRSAPWPSTRTAHAWPVHARTSREPGARSESKGLRHCGAARAHEGSNAARVAPHRRRACLPATLSVRAARALVLIPRGRGAFCLCWCAGHLVREGHTHPRIRHGEQPAAAGAPARRMRLELETRNSRANRM